MKSVEQTMSSFSGQTDDSYDDIHFQCEQQTAFHFHLNATHFVLLPILFNFILVFGLVKA